MAALLAISTGGVANAEDNLQCVPFARMTSGTIDILSVLLWCIDQGLNLGDPPYLNSAYFGWEICNTDTYLGSGATGTEYFVCNNFTYNWSLRPARSATVSFSA